MNYKHKKYTKSYKNYCIDCRKEIKILSKRCHNCANRVSMLNCTLEHKKKIGEANKGKKRSEEFKKNISGKNNSRYNHGNNCSNKIYYCIEKNCNNIVWAGNCRCRSCANKIRNLGIKRPDQSKRMRENNPTKSIKVRRKISLAFGGTGIPYELTEYGPEFDSSLKEQVRFRDKYKCKICSCSQLENGRQLDVHHIDYNKKNNIIYNLISLCMSCHLKTRINRKYWEKKCLNFLIK